jgi:hypothetical protein
MPEIAGASYNSPSPGGDTDEFKSLKRRSMAAWGKRDTWTKVMQDAWDYIAPWRMSTRLYEKAPSNKTERIFDNTGPMSLVRSAGRLQQDLFPPGERWFELEPGPGVQAAGGDPDQVRQELEQLTNVLWPVFKTGEWDMALIEMLMDLLISTGFMMIIEGDEMKPVRFISASMDEMAVDLGPYANIDGVFWKRKWARQAITTNWPRGVFDAEFQEAARSNPEEQVMLYQDVIHTPKGFKLFIYTENAQNPITTSVSLTKPWIHPRYFRLPGEAYGFGPGLLTLPTIKTLNKAEELTLKAAALAMSGVFTRIDDGVFNPDTARIQPGAMWTVERNGGVLGPSIARLDVPGNMNVSNLILQDLRMQVRSGMYDEPAQPQQGQPVSATEIIQGWVQMAQDHAGAYGRLVSEIIMPIVPRVVEVLHHMGVVKTKLQIDQLLVSLKVTSPLAQAFNAARIKPRLDFMQLVSQIAGPQMLHQLMPVPVVLANIAHDMGLPGSEIYPQNVQQAMMQAVQQMATAMAQQIVAQQQQQQNPPAPNGDASQQGAPGGPMQ